MNLYLEKFGPLLEIPALIGQLSHETIKTKKKTTHKKKKKKKITCVESNFEISGQE